MQLERLGRSLQSDAMGGPEAVFRGTDDIEPTPPGGHRKTGVEDDIEWLGGVVEVHLVVHTDLAGIGDELDGHPVRQPGARGQQG